MTRYNDKDTPLYFETHVFCCINQRPKGHQRGCCSSKNAVNLRNYMKAAAKSLNIPNIRINQSGCLDRCELGPTMVIYPEGVWYTYKTKEDVDEILQIHIIEGKLVKRLLLSNKA